MVWFEPERVIRGTQWAVEHPDWILDIPEHNNDTYLLFDLGNPEACHWMSKYIGDMLEEKQHRLLPSGFQYAAGYLLGSQR